MEGYETCPVSDFVWNAADEGRSRNGRSGNHIPPRCKPSQLSITDALNQETTYGYNELGQQISQTDANNHTTRFEYDQLGRRVKRILPGNQFETYSYDTGGNLQRKTDFNSKTTTFTYDVMRRMLSKTPDPSLDQPTIGFTYNVSGQRTTMNDASGSTLYGYDGRSRLASKQTPFGTLSYGYDESGNLLTTRSSNPNGVSVDYNYDALNRLSTVKDNQLGALNGGVTTYTYDTVGNLQSYQYPNAVTSNYGYDSLDHLTAMTVNNGGSALASYSYTLGAAGNRIAVAELGGRTVSYTYDDLYRLTSESISNDPNGVNGSAGYAYDPVGNRLNRSSSIAPIPPQSSTYDANDRLTSDSYDNNGNTTAANGNAYGYDFENHLTSLNGGSVRYVYDGDGHRVAKTAAGVTTNYLVDTNNPTGHAQVIEELQGGVVTRQFTYGHTRISQRIVGSALSFYGYDGHGSVRSLTDAGGAISDTYTYDVFGNLIAQTGSTPNTYLFAGEQYDASVDMIYLRARYYQARAGRFHTVDTYAGEPTRPVTLHRYIYGGNNPVNTVDPTGKYIEEEVEAASIEAQMDAGEIELLEPVTDLATDASSEASTVAEGVEDEIVAEQGPNALGNEGERLAGIVKNTERIDSLTETANYRIPDELDRIRRVLGEEKNVARLGRTKQLLDFAEYAQEEGLIFKLYVRAGTTFSGPLSEMIEEYGIEVIRILP